MALLGLNGYFGERRLVPPPPDAFFLMRLHLSAATLTVLAVALPFLFPYAQPPSTNSGL
jgi:hypothetical protein